MRQIVVQAKIHSLRIYLGKKIICSRRRPEELLAPDDWLHVLERVAHRARAFETVGGLEPITLALRRMRVLPFNIERSLAGLPGKIGAVRVDVLILQEPLEGCADFDSWAGKEDPRARAKCAASFKPTSSVTPTNGSTVSSK